jgi:hypothetical protein
MSNVGGGLRQGRQSIDATSAGSVHRHSPPPFVDRCCVVARVSRAIFLASAGLFSNDHSRADLPLAGTGGLLVVNINQRPSPHACLLPVLLDRHHTLCPVSATTATTRRQLRCFSCACLDLQIGDMLSSTPRTHPVIHSQGISAAVLAGLTRECCGQGLARRHY